MLHVVQAFFSDKFTTMFNNSTAQYINMRKEIEDELFRLGIEAKETRRENAVIVLGVLFAFIVYIMLYYFLIQYRDPYLITFGIVFFVLGGMILFNSIQGLLNPLTRESSAFKKIAEGIGILEKSDDPIAYEEAYRCLKKANQILENLEEKALSDFSWYEGINQELKRFVENSELIILPAAKNSSIRKDDLEDVAVAFLGKDLSGLNAVNDILEKAYQKQKPPPTAKEWFTRVFRETLAGRVLYCLALSYAIVLLVCLIYAAATGQDFVVFARDNPDVIVLGGVFLSGITFWKTK